MLPSTRRSLSHSLAHKPVVLSSTLYVYGVLRNIRTILSIISMYYYGLNPYRTTRNQIEYNLGLIRIHPGTIYGTVYITMCYTGTIRSTLWYCSYETTEGKLPWDDHHCSQNNWGNLHGHEQVFYRIAISLRIIPSGAVLTRYYVLYKLYQTPFKNSGIRRARIQYETACTTTWLTISETQI